MNQYFAAQTYVMLAGKTGVRGYLDNAYKIARSNVTMLYQKQLNMNSDYLTPVANLHRTDPKGATEEQKNDVKEYNLILDNNRKIELPPVYEPLQLNCALLFSLAKEIGVDANEQTWVDGILHKDGNALFLIKPIDDAYCFMPEKNYSASDIPLQLNDGKKLVIPVAFICAESKILVTVQSENGTTVFDDWNLTEVVRNTEGDLLSFFATYKSQSIDKYTYHAGDIITIAITPIDEAEIVPYSIKYNVIDNGVTIPLINLDANWIPHGLTYERVVE